MWLCQTGVNLLKSEAANQTKKTEQVAGTCAAKIRHNSERERRRTLSVLKEEKASDKD